MYIKQHFIGAFNNIVELLVLGLGLGVGFTFTWDNKNHNHNNNPHQNFLKGTVLGAKEQGVGIREKSQGSRDKG